MSVSRPRHGFRPLLILGAVVALLVTAVSPAAAVTPPETTTGQNGTTVFLDIQAGPMVSCHYATGTPFAKLDRFVARPPKVWWPDYNTNVQSGLVGWQVRIQTTTAPDSGPWTTAYKSSIVKKTASVDKVPYDETKKAPFATRGIPWNGGTGQKVYRVVYKVLWYRNGTVLGTRTHWIDNYRATGVASGTLQGYCTNLAAS